MYLDLFSLQGKTALITGATQGIGREIALAYADCGAQVAVVGRQGEKLLALKEEIESTGGKCVAIETDISTLDNINPMVEKAVAELGTLDILVNVAGVNVHKAAEAMTEAEWDQVYDVNIKSLFFCCQAAGKIMLKKGSGKIINMASTFGLVGFANRSAYSTSKAAVVNLTKTLAIEWSEKGINVNAIAPGPVQTPSREELFSDPNFYSTLMTKLPIKRVAVPKDIAAPAVFLASDAAGFITGATLLVDGGWCAQ